MKEPKNEGGTKDEKKARERERDLRQQSERHSSALRCEEREGENIRVGGI